jgi:hypothetical protein
LNDKEFSAVAGRNQNSEQEKTKKTENERREPVALLDTSFEPLLTPVQESAHDTNL